MEKMKSELKLRWYDWFIIILGAIFILSPLRIENFPIRAIGIFIELFMGFLYLSERWSKKEWK
jgi:hypothetical protein